MTVVKQDWFHKKLGLTPENRRLSSRRGGDDDEAGFGVLKNCGVYRIWFTQFLFQIFFSMLTALAERT
ncbi:hypothetical protein Q31b_15740 [Novipirellula aureliae]|uniref:Uncharacterized protein n=1 Tax=Novipirellula aureliae TaxID=2527966 RepID=A0A5C6EA57_9BACT|nr:hypothetical protein Q31b_15740 [Novipirellula aureliae]